MEQTIPVPSVAFDPNQHVIAGRQLADGRQLFFYSHRSSRQRGIEQGPVPDVTQADLERIERKVLAAVQAAVPPPSSPSTS